MYCCITGPGYRSGAGRLWAENPQRAVPTTTKDERYDGHSGDVVDPESHERLKTELDALIANRPVIAAEINERREGDLKENGGYHAAREEQGQQEARIRQLQEAPQQRQGRRGPHPVGCRAPRLGREGVLRRRREGHGDVPDRHPRGFRPGRRPRVYPSSPLGAALIDAKVGETRSTPSPAAPPSRSRWSPRTVPLVGSLHSRKRARPRSRTGATVVLAR